MGLHGGVGQFTTPQWDEDRVREETSMAETMLEKRVAALEKKVAELTERALSPPVREDWRSTVGMFAGNALMKEIDEEGRRIREADREQARRDRS